MRKKVKIALLSAALGWSSAWAYAPPASFIIKTMTSKHGNGKGVRIRSNLTVFASGQSEGSSPVRFKLVHQYISETGTLRSVLSDENGRPIYLFERNMTSSPMPVDVPVQALSTILLDSHPLEVTRILRGQSLALPQAGMEAGGASEAVFLSRINKAIAWVIGERGASRTGPQLWVEKDTFLPLRWAGKTQMDFQNYRIYRDLFYPRMIQVSELSRPLFKEELVELKVAPVDLKGEAKTNGFTETGSSLPEPVRETIQRYFEAQ